MNVSPIVDVSGRPTRRSDQIPERNRSSGVPTTGSSAPARYLKHVIARPSSSNRICQKHELPLKIAAFPPAATCASSASRMPHDQYSS